MNKLIAILFVVAACAIAVASATVGYRGSYYNSYPYNSYPYYGPSGYGYGVRSNLGGVSFAAGVGPAYSSYSPYYQPYYQPYYSSGYYSSGPSYYPYASSKA